jgi:hypothetical protein|tara:strand:- start:119 stop:310 length:192 start_codon:yes stop_codon:yes gene_type:complete
MTQHERTMQDLQKISDLLIIIDKMYDILQTSDNINTKRKANDLFAEAIAISSQKKNPKNQKQD